MRGLRRTRQGARRCRAHHCARRVDGRIYEYALAASTVDQVLAGPDGGPTDGLNRALRVSTSPFWYYLNADDFLLPEAFNFSDEELALIDANDIVLANALFVDQHGRPLRPFRARERSVPTEFALGLYPVPQQGTIIRTDLLQSVGGFNTQNRLSWDSEALLDVALHGGRIATIDRTVAAFRLHNNSITVSGRRDGETAQVRSRLLSKAAVGSPGTGLFQLQVAGRWRETGEGFLTWSPTDEHRRT